MENIDMTKEEIFKSLCQVAQGYPINEPVRISLDNLGLIDYKTMRGVNSLTKKGLNYILTYE